MKIAIIGTGAYSLAIAKALSKNSNNLITMWSENELRVKEFDETKKLESILPGITLFDKLSITTSFSKAMEGAELIIIAVAAKFLDIVVKSLYPYYTKNMHIVIATKGIDQKSALFAHEILLRIINTKKYALISGPSFAIDMATEEPVGLSIASNNKTTLKVVKDSFKGSNVKLHLDNDMVGIEICGSIKNVIAIATGIIAGLGYSESTQVFLINEALHDIKELIEKLGGNKKTILAFAGVGDLLLTCTSKKSRNYSFGVIVGEGKSKEELDKYLNECTVEGFYTVKSIYKLIKKRKVSVPIIDLIYKILINGKDPQLLITYLMKK